MKPQSRVTHPPRVPVRPSNPPLIDPIYHSVKFTTDTWAEMERIYTGREEGFTYARISNPTVRQLELLLAELQGREDALTFCSGVAAISATLLSLLQAGDHVVHFVESYKPSRGIIRSLLGRYGVRSTLLSLGDFSALEETLRTQKTRVILFESPTNPTLKLVDVEKLTALAQDRGVITILDNTFAGFHHHGEFPVDLYLHSLTKFAGGHGDATGGVIIGRSSLVQKIRLESWALGAALDPMTAAQVTRGMKTYFLRYERQCENALAVARWLASAGSIRNLRYPGLPSHQEHELARKQIPDFGTMITFDLPEALAIGTFLDRLKLFTLTASLGSTDSLVAPGLAFYGSDLSPDELSRSGITASTVRLSIGIEDPADLIQDLQAALEL